jgi:hypothetical protein
MHELDADLGQVVGLIRIKTHGRRYEPVRTGFNALVIPDSLRTAIITDLVTGGAGHPRRWWQRSGDASVLAPKTGEPAEKLAVFATPERWLIGASAASSFSTEITVAWSTIRRPSSPTDIALARHIQKMLGDCSLKFTFGATHERQHDSARGSPAPRASAPQG